MIDYNKNLTLQRIPEFFYDFHGNKINTILQCHVLVNNHFKKFHFFDSLLSSLLFSSLLFSVDSRLPIFFPQQNRSLSSTNKIGDKLFIQLHVIYTIMKKNSIINMRNSSKK